MYYVRLVKKNEKIKKKRENFFFINQVIKYNEVDDRLNL